MHNMHLQYMGHAASDADVRPGASRPASPPARLPASQPAQQAGKPAAQHGRPASPAAPALLNRK